MKTSLLELYWNDIPTSKEEAVTYEELIKKWCDNERVCRKILQELSCFDNGDNFILIRSGRSNGFYKTDDITEIQQFKIECLNKGRSVLAPIRKMNRVLNTNSEQYSFNNNLRAIRESKDLTQSEVCDELAKYDKAIDKAMLSKMENGICLPTPFQLAILAKIYGCYPSDLIGGDFIY